MTTPTSHSDQIETEPIKGVDVPICESQRQKAQPHRSEHDAEEKLLSKINKAVREKDATAFLAAIEESRSAQPPATDDKPNYSICSKHLNREDGCPLCWPNMGVSVGAVKSGTTGILTAQPPATDDKPRWTLGTIAKYLPTNVGIPAVFFTQLLAAINAALAAAYRSGGDFARDQCANEENEDLLRLEQKLAAEREKLKQAGR